MTEEEKAIEHCPVLLNESIDALAIDPDGIYIDCTFGRGGHAKAILDRLSDQGRLFAIDKDPRAVQTAIEQFGNDKRFRMWHGSYAELDELAKEYDLAEKVDGIFLDLGVSSPQLDDATRGFSFAKDGPLDMRMNPEKGMDAATWIQKVKEEDLANVLRTYGEERFAKRIANAIINARQQEPIVRTKQLAKIIADASPWREKHKHPATRSFQAIRIYINHELEELENCLEQTINILKIGGRLVVICFHSLESQLVKSFIRKYEKGADIPDGLPILQKDLNIRMKHIGKAIKPSEEEMDQNPRARSSILRIAEKVS